MISCFIISFGKYPVSFLLLAIDLGSVSQIDLKKKNRKPLFPGLKFLYSLFLLLLLLFVVTSFLFLGICQKLFPVLVWRVFLSLTRDRSGLEIFLIYYTVFSATHCLVGKVSILSISQHFWNILLPLYN